MEDSVPHFVQIFDLKSQATDGKSQDERRLICDQIADLLTTNGRVLFEYRFFTAQYGGPPAGDQWRVAKLWESLPTEEQSQWRLFNKQALRDLEQLSVSMFTKGQRSAESRHRAFRVAQGASLDEQGYFIFSGTESVPTPSIGLPMSYSGVVAETTTTVATTEADEHLRGNALEIRRFKHTAQTNGSANLQARPYTRLLRHITIDGRGLFEYHAYYAAERLCQPGSNLEKRSLSLAKIWPALPQDDKEYWRLSSHSLRNGLEARQPSTLCNLDLEPESPRQKAALHKATAEEIVLRTVKADDLATGQNGSSLCLENLTTLDDDKDTHSSEQTSPTSDSMGPTAPSNHDLAAMIYRHPALETDIAGLLTLLDGLAEESDEDDRAFILSSLADEVTEDGQALFEYHALSLLTPAMCAENRLLIYVPQLVYLWEKQSKHGRNFWKKQSKQLKKASGTGKNQDGVLKFFEVRTHTRRSLDYAEKASIALLAAAESGKYGPMRIVMETLADLSLTFPPEIETQQEQAARQASNKLIVLHTVHGGDVERGSLVAAIPVILQQIRRKLKKIMNSKTTVRLTGRSAGVRINFDPNASGVTSISARLRQACSRSLTKSVGTDGEEPRERFEWLLRPLIYWNLHRDSFDVIKYTRQEKISWVPKEDRKNYNEHNMSCLNWLGSRLAELRPFTAEKKHETVRLILDELRKHIPKVLEITAESTSRARLVYLSISGTESSLGPFWSWWSLADEKGFGAFLLQCFAREHLSSQEYEDLLEQDFFALRSFVFKHDEGEDPFKLDEKPTAIPNLSIR